jgi:hypothetical protein
MTPGYTDYLGRRIRVGAVVVYAVLGRIGDRQPLRRGVVLGFEDYDAWIRMLPDSVRGRRPATVRIPPARVLVMPTALSRRQAAQLRAHVVRSRTPSEQAQRRERPVPNVLTTAPTTPEQIVEWAAGIGDARQAEYQRKMSALLAGRA